MTPTMKGILEAERLLDIGRLRQAQLRTAPPKMVLPHGFNVAPSYVCDLVLDEHKRREKNLLLLCGGV